VTSPAAPPSSMIGPGRVDQRTTPAMGLFPLSVERHVNSAVAEHAFGVTTVTRAAQYTAFHGLIAEEASKRGLTKEAVDQPNARIADLEAAVEPAQADSALANERIVTAESRAAAAQSLAAGLRETLAMINPAPAKKR